LLSNGIKFSDETNGTIKIAITENRNAVEIQIANNGKQIDKEDLEAVFDKFYQSRNQNIKNQLEVV